LYAQEIVARLGVAQSAASRHLSQLERAGIVTVAARRGSKYYAVNGDRLEALASALTERGSRARALRA
jgi:DNA-binding transcriptional ArsR family regulator